MKKFFILPLIPLYCFGQTSFELNSGTKRTGIDLTYSTALDSAQHWLLLSRNMASAQYNKASSVLSFNSVAYTFKSGVGITTNTFFTNTNVYTCIGLQYILSREDLFIYAYITMKISRVSFSDHFIFIAWQPRLNTRLKLLLQNEMNISLIERSNDFTLLRLKGGLNFHGKFQAGLMNEFSTHSNTNTGLFIKKLF